MLYHIVLQTDSADMAVVFREGEKSMRSSALDRLGICVSAACIVQCLALPLLVILTPLVSVGFLGGDSFHLMLLAVILPITLVAFALGFRVHGDHRVLLPGLVGLTVVILAAALEGLVFDRAVATALTSIGGLLLITGHWFNLRQRRRACLRPKA